MDALNGFANPLAAKTRITVSDFHRLIRAGGRSAGHICPAPDFIIDANGHANGRHSTVVNDFIGFYVRKRIFLHHKFPSKNAGFIQVSALLSGLDYSKKIPYV